MTAGDDNTTPRFAGASRADANNNDNPAAKERTGEPDEQRRDEKHARWDVAKSNEALSGNVPRAARPRLADSAMLVSRTQVGSPARIPTLDEVLSKTPVFSGRSTHRWGISGGAAITVACALAVASAVGLTGFLGKNTTRRAAVVQETPVQELTMSETQPGQESTSPPQLNDAGQQTEPAYLRVAAQDTGGFMVANITGAPGDALPVRVNLPHPPSDEYSFLMVRGLPANITMSSGFRLKESWAVSLRDVADLTLQAPPEFEGRFTLEFLLIRGRDTPAESRLVTVTIENRAVKSRNYVDSSRATQIPTSTPPAGMLDPVEKQMKAPEQPPRAVMQPAISPEEETQLLDKAAQQLAAFDVASARLLFAHLANRGSAKAALALGQTYDPAYFRATAIRGMQPDIAKAKEWYRKAADLGNSEAALRLQAMNVQ